MSVDNISPIIYNDFDLNENDAADTESKEKERSQREMDYQENLIAKYMPYKLPNLNIYNTLRSKRENPKFFMPAAIDEEYIKQLENSFPQDQGNAQQQEDNNNNEDNDDDKQHIRVKRQ